jgi:hypothetical protein
MVGKHTQTDVSMLGTFTVQTELDNRLAKYVGYISRMSPSRWEKRLLSGIALCPDGEINNGNKDPWWERVGIGVKEIMAIHGRDEPWFAVAGRKDDWRKLRDKWLLGHKGGEHKDTQASRMCRWREASLRYNSDDMIKELWSKAKNITADGTSLEGANPDWLRKVIRAGGVSPDGWVQGVPDTWKVAFEQPSAQLWLRKMGGHVRRRLQGKRWDEGFALFPVVVGTGDNIPMWRAERRRITSKRPAASPVLIAPPPLPPPGGDAQLGRGPRRRLSHKQPVRDPSPARPAEASAGVLNPGRVEAVAVAGKIACEKCGILLKPISMEQHLKWYCPFREGQDGADTRGGRKTLRAAPPKKAVAEAPKMISAEELAALGPIPHAHVRWHAPRPQAKRQASSLPGPPGEDARTVRLPPRPAMRPKGALNLTGCYGGCASCNACVTCRNRTCNGTCPACKRCAACRPWGERLGAGEAEVVGKHAESLLLPPVERRKKVAAKAAPEPRPVRPANALAGNQLCPYCEKWLPTYHRENCPSVPYELWTHSTRTRQLEKFGEEVVNSWIVQCQHCAIPFQSANSKRVHLSGFERR